MRKKFQSNHWKKFPKISLPSFCPTMKIYVLTIHSSKVKEKVEVLEGLNRSNGIDWLLNSVRRKALLNHNHASSIS